VPLITDPIGDVPHPRCSCHGWKACVHDYNGKPDPDGQDIERGWNWHCLIDGCEGYSLVMVMLREWADEINTEWQASKKALEEARGPGYSPPDLGELAELMRKSRDQAETEARDSFHGCGLRPARQ